MKIIDVFLCLIILILSVSNIVFSMRLYNVDRDIEYLSKSLNYTNDRQTEIENELSKQKRIIAEDLKILNQGFENER